MDISKAFDKVWHKGLLAKLRQIGVSGSLFTWFKGYLSERQQRVVIEGFHSSWKGTHAGVPQGSVLGPLLFLIYINDIQSNVQSSCFLFADDSFLLEEIIDSPNVSALRLNQDLQSILSWSNQWLVTMNESKTKSMLFSLKRIRPSHPLLKLNDITIDEVSSHEHLGLTLLSNMSWRAHILKIHQKASKKLNLLKGLKFKLSRRTLEILYKSLVRSNMEYADVVWDGCTLGKSDLLENLQYEAARVVTGAIKGTHRENVLKDVAWNKLEHRVIYKLILIYKIINKLTLMSFLC